MRVYGGTRPPMKTILVPVDFSKVTPAVVREAALLAKAHQAWVMLLTVTQPPVVANEYGAFPVNVAEIVEANVKAAQTQLARCRQQLKRRGIACETRQFTGAVAPLIVEEAKTLRADYIVIGSHGHSAFYDLLVGSTTHGVLLKAPCPVLIVPAPRSRPPRKRRKG